MAEGSSTPELNEFGEIVGSPPPAEKPESSPWVDPDDLPENQGMIPAVNLARLREGLKNAKPVKVTDTGELKELPVTPPPQTK